MELLLATGYVICASIVILTLSVSRSSQIASGLKYQQLQTKLLADADKLFGDVQVLAAKAEDLRNKIRALEKAN